MEPSLLCIYVVNIFGAILLAVIAIGNVWRLPRRNIENMALLLMLFLGFINCLTDPIVFSIDGQPSALKRFINFAGNGWLFASNMVCSLLWFIFLSQHTCGGVSKIHNLILKAIVGFGALCIVANIFVPFIYFVDDGGTYHRLWGFWILTIIDYSITIDSVVVYFWSRMRNGILKYFPIWVYLLPLLLGTLAQSLVYGISTISAGYAIAVAGVFTSLQNEQIFRDPLTGLYNRLYLDYHINLRSMGRGSVITGMMLDLNSFKKINDDFGHSVGDRALVTLAEILQRTVRNRGVAIRYAGDEFIVLLNTRDSKDSDTFIKFLRRKLEKFNKATKEPYQLSTSIGKGLLDVKKHDMDYFISTIDHAMYEDKKAYYAANTEIDRRHR